MVLLPLPELALPAHDSLRRDAPSRAPRSSLFPGALMAQTAWGQMARRCIAWHSEWKARDLPTRLRLRWSISSGKWLT